MVVCNYSQGGLMVQLRERLEFDIDVRDLPRATRILFRIAGHKKKKVWFLFQLFVGVEFIGFYCMFRSTVLLQQPTHQIACVSDGWRAQSLISR